MKHLGDITKINGAEIEIVDVITGGSPCQDLSIAGKRAGLAGARSGLFMAQIRIVKEMREHDRANGRTGDMVRPRFMVWENVPGAFSSNKGKDFAAVLEEIIRIAEPEAPDIDVPEKGWPTWGGYHDEVGGRWSVAWRVHDAQHWGVPQRRRRISVVADFGGDTAGEILFERKSVSRHPAESGTARERLAGAAQDGASYAVRIRGGCDGGGKGALVQTEKSGTLGTHNDQTIFAAIPINDKATRWQGGGESRNHDGSGNGLGIGKEGDPSPTLTAGDRHGVAYISGVDGYNGDLTGDVASTIGVNCGMSTGRCGVMELFANENGGMARDSVLCAGFKAGTDLVCSSVDCRNFREGGEVNGTLQAKESGGQSLNLNNTVRQNMVVRRLTPMECERLQGFPDHWTDIGKWTDEKGKKHKDADSPRYKALGNSIALPFWGWMLRRMARYLAEGATLGSLFDGIGGFPLIWERIHGEGTARWASEIEEFPIAVTKLRFGED